MISGRTFLVMVVCWMTKTRQPAIRESDRPVRSQFGLQLDQEKLARFPLFYRGICPLLNLHREFAITAAIRISLGAMAKMLGR